MIGTRSLPGAAVQRAENHTVRVARIDAIKGAAALLVVLGHALPLAYPSSYDRNPLFILIYSFHMPLFMFVTGYVYAGRLDVPVLPWIFWKAVKLLPVYALWHVLFALYNRDYSFLSDPGGFWAEALIHPDAPWFLPVLFLCLVVLLAVAKAGRKWGGWAYAAFFAAAVLLPWPDSFGLVKVKWYAFFMVAGYLLPGAYAVLSRSWPLPELLRRRGLAAVIPFLLFPALIIGRLLWADMPANVDFGRLNDWWRSPSTWWLHYALALAGILYSFRLATALELRFSLRPFAWIGRRSLELYLLHGIFLWVGVGTGSLRAASAFLGATLASLAVAVIARKTPFAGPLLFGVDAGKGRQASPEGPPGSGLARAWRNAELEPDPVGQAAQEDSEPPRDGKALGAGRAGLP